MVFLNHFCSLQILKCVPIFSPFFCSPFSKNWTWGYACYAPDFYSNGIELGCRIFFTRVFSFSRSFLKKRNIGIKLLLKKWIILYVQIKTVSLVTNSSVPVSVLCYIYVFSQFSISYIYFWRIVHVFVEICARTQLVSCVNYSPVTGYS